MSANVFQLESHDYITGEKLGMYVGRKAASNFALGERWFYEYTGETSKRITSKVCVKHARKYVYFAHCFEDAAFASRVTMVDKAELVAYSLGHATFVIVARAPQYAVAPVVPRLETGNAQMLRVAVAPEAIAPVVAQPTSDTCPVCLTDYDIKDMAETACHHNFCDACAMKLYRMGTTACPMCRSALSFKVGARV